MKLCPTCIKEKDSGICTSCKTAFYPAGRELFNDVGHCEDCRFDSEHFALIDSTEKTKWCKQCNDVVNNNISNYCNTCATKKDMCTHCNINQKYITEYCCDLCKIEYMKKEKKSRLQL